jgi:hypothetical protein
MLHPQSAVFISPLAFFVQLVVALMIELLLQLGPKIQGSPYFPYYCKVLCLSCDFVTVCDIFAATRAKMATMGALSKVRGATNKAPYPQTEGLLAETMSKYGKAMGEQSDLGRALNESSEAYKQMADIRYELENAVTQNFLDPLAHLQNTDLKEVNVSDVHLLRQCLYVGLCVRVCV